jgi:hypothetical protein
MHKKTRKMMVRIVESFYILYIVWIILVYLWNIQNNGLFQKYVTIITLTLPVVLVETVATTYRGTEGGGI